ncbi:inner membrane-spanning protein YciB [Pseudemcibacter aquimaris]|uniref:inner membrane-spanning protein YciB n=1 Tax=Pseudemcibacter aquimaris TaxID=2857064 RepID=UPI002011AAC1|nr:inner membrane-spanning protein YciB [Pseudemcibacter aquimaris]MCC3861959.1 septation protein IspZ [Pseudemcibacter aquimaris]WDU58710.1 septation protein IspZ [Pseudemcibacter aquimaris]
MSNLPNQEQDVKQQFIKLLIEIGPVFVFIWANKHYSDENGMGGAVPAIKVFMIAMAISLIASKIYLGKISRMLLASGALVGFFGALSIYFDDEFFMKIKPTVLYGIFATVLLGGVLGKKAFLKNVFKMGLPPMKDEGWLILSRNWGIYFLICAILNEIIWRNFSFADWLWAKLWLFIPLSFVFAFTQVPVMMKHQIEEENVDD